MEIIPLSLTPSQIKRLNKVAPNSRTSAGIGKRAMEIVKLHFKMKKYPFEEAKPSSGADLLFKRNNKRTSIEVKGTADFDIAWRKLRISGEQSFKRLKKGMLLYRVNSVFRKNPVISILQFGKDYRIRREPR